MDDNYEKLRWQMVDRQLIPRGIKNRKVLDAFGHVPRENFVSEKRRRDAYKDCPLPLTSGQTISQPYIVALMTELLAIPEGKPAKVLEIGAGSGYQAAILAYMGIQVVSIERLEPLFTLAQENLSTVPYGENVTVHLGDGCLGREEDAPYDGVIVTAASPKTPEMLVKQLHIGAKLVIPCGSRFLQDLLVITKNSEHHVSTENHGGCRFVPLIGDGAFDS